MPVETSKGAVGKKRVVLVYTKTGWDIRNVTSLLPLSVLYLGKPLLAAGYDVAIVDQRIDDHWEQTLLNLVKDPGTMAVGISAMTGLQIRWGLAAAALVRKISPKLPLIWGGIHPSLLPEQTATHPLVDVVVQGEGERTLPAVLNAIEKGESLEGIPGIGLEKDGSYTHCDPPDFIDLDDVLFPDYSLLNVEDYVTTQTLGLRDLSITTSRGCPNRCAYCYNVPYAKRRWRAQSADHVVEHIRYIARQYRLQGILIKDDNFFVNAKRVEQIADGLKDMTPSLTLRAECRADYIARQWDPDFLSFLAANGFKEMTVGAESGSNETLGILQKDITVDDIRETNRRLKRAGIAAKFTFMTGYPNETPDHVKQTLNLMLDLVKESPYARVTPLHLFSPYPGTQLYETSVKIGFTPPEKLEDWALMDFHRADLPWLSKEFSKKLEKISVSTYFLDGRTIPEYFSKSPIMRIVAKIYGAVVRFRAKRFFFSWMPELALFEWVRKRKKMV